MYYVYILQLENGECYSGYTKDLRARLAEHKRGTTVTTNRLPPEKLLYYAAFETKKLALEFERYLKMPSGFAFRNKRLIETQI